VIIGELNADGSYFNEDSNSDLNEDMTINMSNHYSVFVEFMLDDVD
jgi:hypothetical protein